jgi:hypothetical protein
MKYNWNVYCCDIEYTYRNKIWFIPYGKIKTETDTSSESSWWLSNSEESAREWFESRLKTYKQHIRTFTNRKVIDIKIKSIYPINVNMQELYDFTIMDVNEYLKERGINFGR